MQTVIFTTAVTTVTHCHQKDSVYTTINSPIGIYYLAGLDQLTLKLYYCQANAA